MISQRMIHYGVLVLSMVVILVLQYPMYMNSKKMSEDFTRVVAPCTNCDQMLEFPGNPVDQMPDVKYAYGYDAINQQYGAGNTSIDRLDDAQKWILKTVGNRKDPEVQRYIDVFKNPYLDQSLPKSTLETIDDRGQPDNLYQESHRPVIVYVVK